MKTFTDRLSRWARLDQLTRIERRTLAAGGMATASLLVALAWTCQQSVERGERLRAERSVTAAPSPRS